MIYLAMVHQPVAIKANGNFSSITDNGTGDYTLNFASSLVDANYSVSGVCLASDQNVAGVVSILTTGQNGSPVTKTTSALRIATYWVDRNSKLDLSDVSVQIVR